jgi:hypothetical protein
MEAGQHSPSGVWVASDFRDNLIIDRYDPVFFDMRASKIKHLRSANSEDAVTWNVFRSLRQVAPAHWLPMLWKAAFPEQPPVADSRVAVRLWESIAPPPGLLEDGDEGHSEIDVLIESPTWAWCIEAKYRSDISMGTTTRPQRDQVLRNIDVGSYYAGTRKFYFSLLIADVKRSPEGVKAVERYAEMEEPRRLLKDHRPDGLANVQAITLLRWHQLAEVLKAASLAALREDERQYANRAAIWLTERGLAAV